MFRLHFVPLNMTFWNGSGLICHFDRSECNERSGEISPCSKHVTLSLSKGVRLPPGLLRGQSPLPVDFLFVLSDIENNAPKGSSIVLRLNLERGNDKCKN